MAHDVVEPVRFLNVGVSIRSGYMSGLNWVCRPLFVVNHLSATQSKPVNTWNIFLFATSPYRGLSNISYCIDRSLRSLLCHSSPHPSSVFSSGLDDGLSQPRASPRIVSQRLQRKDLVLTDLRRLRKLPSIADSIAQIEELDAMRRLQAHNRIPNPQYSSTRITEPTFDTVHLNAILPSSGPPARNNIDQDFPAQDLDWLETRTTSSCYWSPAKDSLFNQADSGPSTASTSPRFASSPRTSRASSLSSLSLPTDIPNHDGVDISAAQIELVCQKMEEIFESTPRERASNSENQHTLDERRRRALHKKFIKEHDRVCESVLIRLRDPNSKLYQEGFPPQLVQAIMTGNHKAQTTKLATHIASLVTVLIQAKLVLRQAAEIDELRSERRRLHERVSSLEQWITGLTEEMRALRERTSGQARRIARLEEEEQGLREQNAKLEGEVLRLCTFMEDAGISPMTVKQQHIPPPPLSSSQATI